MLHPGADDGRWAAGDHLPGKRVGEHASSLLLRDAARTQVEQRVFVQSAHRGTMGALHVVGENLEARPGVHFGVVGKKQVLVGLTGVGPERPWPDDDVPVEHPMGTPVHNALVELATGTARRHVLDKDRVVVLLIASRQVQSLEVHLGSFSLEGYVHFVAGDGGSEVCLLYTS